MIVMPSAHPHGGAEEALLQFCRYCAPAGIASLKVIFLETGELVDVVRAMGHQAEAIQAGRLRQVRRFFQAVRAIKSEIIAFAPDAVLSWMTKAHIYAGVAARFADVKSFYFQMGLPDKGVVDRLCGLVPAAGALACSDFVATAQQKLVRHPVLSVLIAADHERFAPARALPAKEAKQRCGLPPDNLVVGIVGRLQRWKGMHVFVEAMAGIVNARPHVRGLIVGGPHALEPDYEKLLKGQIASLGLEDRIRMVGAQRNVPEWMAAMDVIVHASDREPFGIVVVEAMVLGKPVIATIPGGPAEILQDGVDGQLVPFGEAMALKKAIERYLDDPEFAKKCGQAAKMRAEKFHPKVFTQKLVESLHEILEHSLSRN